MNFDLYLAHCDAVIGNLNAGLLGVGASFFHFEGLGDRQGIDESLETLGMKPGARRGRRRGCR